MKPSEAAAAATFDFVNGQVVPRKQCWAHRERTRLLFHISMAFVWQDDSKPKSVDCLHQTGNTSAQVAIEVGYSALWEPPLTIMARYFIDTEAWSCAPMVCGYKAEPCAELKWVDTIPGQSPGRAGGRWDSTSWLLRTRLLPSPFVSGGNHRKLPETQSRMWLSLACTACGEICHITQALQQGQGLQIVLLLIRMELADWCLAFSCRISQGRMVVLQGQIAPFPGDCLQWDSHGFLLVHYPYPVRAEDCW